MTIKMKQLLILIAACLLWPLGAFAQYEEDTENGVVSLAGKEGFSIATKKGDFVFKPYLLVQTSASVNYYDDEGLDPAYNQDNIHNTGFAIPYAILGFTGKAFNRVTFKGEFSLSCGEIQDAFYPCLSDHIGRNLDAYVAGIVDFISDSTLFLECCDTQYRNRIRFGRRGTWVSEQEVRL